MTDRPDPGRDPFLRFRDAAALQSTGDASQPVAAVRRERRRRRILDALDTLPTLPGIVARIVELANDADTRAADFEKIIVRDPALAAKVLKLVNSAFFGLRQKVTSITHAVVLLGFKTIKSIVIAAKTSQLLNRQLREYGFDEGGLWKHSVSCATICHFLSRRTRLNDELAEELFVAGLLHDVGKIVIAPHLADLRTELADSLERHGGDHPAAEQELLGTSHDEIGGLMARRWNLAPGLGFLIASHHRAATGSDDVGSLHELRIANDLCHQLGIGRADGPREPSPSYPQWLAAIGLEGDDDFDADVRTALVELRDVFETVVRDPKPASSLE